MSEADWIEYTGTIGKRKPFVVTENDVVKNLTGWTITLKAWIEGEDALAFSGSVVVTDAENGECYYEFKNGDLPSTLARRWLLVQLWLDEDAGDDLVPTETKRLQIKEGPPA